MPPILRSINNLAWAALGLGAGVAIALSAAAATDPFPPVPPQPPSAAIPHPAERVLPVFETHCARCHQAGSAAKSGDTGTPEAQRTPDWERAALLRFGNVMSLDEIAQDPGLVLPGRPDASPLYQRMLSNHGPNDIYGLATGGKGPTPEEIETIRDWIDSLLPMQNNCDPPSNGASAEASELMTRWLAGPDANGTRFVSLLHLRHACAPASTIAAAREAVANVISAYAGKPGPAPLDTIGDDNALLAVRLEAAGLTDEQWESLTSGAPLLAGIATPGDWLAERIIASGATLDPATLPAASRLARLWQRDVDLYRAAAELNLVVEALRNKLQSVEGDELSSARRLLHGTLPRARWEQLRAHLAGTPPPPRVKPAPDATTIDLSLWSDKLTYTSGDLLTLNIQPDKACHLSLIAVDKDGKAIVVYPNEMEPENLIAPGVVTRVPSPIAPYQLRLDRKGNETIVAVCRRRERHIEGVAVNYERQRFPVLGDWRGFLRLASEREAEIARRAEERERSSRRRRRSSDNSVAEEPAIDPTGPALEGRAAITISVD